MDRLTHTHKIKERDRLQKDRQTEKQRDNTTDRQDYRQTEKTIDRKTERHTRLKTDRHTDYRQTEKFGLINPNNRIVVQMKSTNATNTTPTHK